MIGASVANEVLKVYRSLSCKGKPRSNEWTCLSAFVVQTASRFTVISIATGTKCIGFSLHTKHHRRVIRDMHSEVLARRALRRAVYQHLLSSPQHDDADAIQALLRDDKAKLHFFTTQLPCGDASITPMMLAEDVSAAAPTSYSCGAKRAGPDINRTGAKVQRTGAEADSREPGVDYHVTGVLRTKPGRGEPSLSHSCSDKIVRWLHQGVQGTLLGEHLTLRIATIIICDRNFDRPSVSRALLERFSCNTSHCQTIFGKGPDLHCLNMDELTEDDRRTLAPFFKPSTKSVTVPGGRRDSVPSSVAMIAFRTTNSQQFQCEALSKGGFLLGASDKHIEEKPDRYSSCISTHALMALHLELHPHKEVVKTDTDKLMDSISQTKQQLAPTTCIRRGECLKRCFKGLWGADKKNNHC